MPHSSLYATHNSPAHGVLRDDLTEVSGAASTLPPLNSVTTRPTDIKNFNFGVFSEGEKPADYNKFLADYKRERERMQKKGIDIMVRWSSDRLSRGRLWESSRQHWTTCRRTSS